MSDPLTSFARRWLSLYRGPGLHARFEELALGLFRAQWDANAAYRRYGLIAGADPASVTDWRRIPAVPTSAFKELDLTSIEPGQRTRVFHSSGTTAQRPSRHFHNAASLEVYEASLVAGFETGFWRRPGSEGFANGPDPWQGWVPLSLTPCPEQAPHSSLVHMIECLGDRCGRGPTRFGGGVDTSGGWTVDMDRVGAWLGAVEAGGERCVVFGTAFGLGPLGVARAGEGVRFRLPAGSRVMETGGYKGRSRVLAKDELRRAIGRCLGVADSDIVGEYGMSELGSQAYERPAGSAGLDGVSGAGGDRVFEFPAWARPLVISPETGCEVRDGEPGLLRLIDLANVWSVLAVQTEDRVVKRDGGIGWLGRAPASEPRGCSLMAV
jgi:hypothetical protein